MARTKNRGYQQTLTPTYTARLWKMGGYIRLSREDLQKINRGRAGGAGARSLTTTTTISSVSKRPAQPC